MISDEVANTLEKGRNVVALETTIVVQGLPAPVNLEVAEECEEAVREGGAVPATIGVLDGRVVVGLSTEQTANDWRTRNDIRPNFRRVTLVSRSPRTVTARRRSLGRSVSRAASASK